MLGKYDLSADVFSFGIVLTEALAAKEAQSIIEETRTGQFGLSLSGVQNLVREGSPPVCNRLVALAHRCCRLNPTERPVADELSRISEALEADPLAFEGGGDAPTLYKPELSNSRRSSTQRGGVAAAWSMHLRDMIPLSARVRDGSEYATL